LFRLKLSSAQRPRSLSTGERPPGWRSGSVLEELAQARGVLGGDPILEGARCAWRCSRGWIAPIWCAWEPVIDRLASEVGFLGFWECGRRPLLERRSSLLGWRRTVHPIPHYPIGVGRVGSHARIIARLKFTVTLTICQFLKKRPPGARAHQEAWWSEADCRHPRERCQSPSRRRYNSAFVFTPTGHSRSPPACNV